MKKTNLQGKIVLIFLVVFISSLVSAANIGVSPANINFKNVLRGGYAERPITLTIDAPELVDVTLGTWGEVKDWITLSDTKVKVSKGSPTRIIVSINPPNDTPNGNYSGFVRINISKLSEGIEGAASSSIIPTLDLAVNVEIVDRQIVECKASEFKIFSAEEGEEIIFTAKISNEGNIRFYPKINFKIWDQESINLVKDLTYDEIQIIPTQEKEFNIRIPSKGLQIGQYWVDVSAIECFNQQTLTFDVLEEGALRAEGLLESIIVIPWADINDIVPINISFKNTGEKPLDARFSGKIMSKNKIIQLLESDKDIFVPTSSQENFQFYFTPKEAGRYVISGRVFYDSKRTYEGSAILNVRPGGVFLDKIMKFLLYTILLIIIAILIYKIRKERKTYNAKWRLLRR
jgi:hypothetical protein